MRGSLRSSTRLFVGDDLSGGNRGGQQRRGLPRDGQRSIVQQAPGGADVFGALAPPAPAGHQLGAALDRAGPRGGGPGTCPRSRRRATPGRTRGRSGARARPTRRPAVVYEEHAGSRKQPEVEFPAVRREDATLRAQEQPARPGRVGPSGRVARAPSRCIRTGSPSGVHGARGAARIRPTSSRSTTRPSARGAGCRLTSRLPIAPLPAAKASTCGSRPRRTCAGASREVSLVRAWIHGSDNGENR